MNLPDSFQSVFVALLLNISIALEAQPYVHDYPQFDFVDYERNKLEYYGSDQPMSQFYKKLDSLLLEGKRQINILHVGGSHVQAGIWTSAVREALHSMHPGMAAGRGLVFPYRAAKTNDPIDYTTDFGGRWEGCRNVEKTKDCNLGISGISLTTKHEGDWIRINLARNRVLSYQFTNAIVFHSTDSLSFEFEFPDDRDAIIQSHPEKGYSKVLFTKELNTLHLSVKRTDSLQRYFTCYGFRLETNLAGIYYDASGINGADVSAYLRSTNMARDLEIAPPDLVIFSIGINDALYPDFSAQAYKDNYRELIRRIKRVSPNAAIVFTTNSDSYFKRRHVNPNGEAVKQAMQELSGEFNTALWDLYSIMGGRGSIDTWVKARLAKTDKLHFSNEGYRLLGRLLASALVQDYQKHLVETAAR